VDINSEDIMLTKTKEQIIEIMKCVFYAPYCRYPYDEGCTDDLIGYEVVCKNLNRVPTDDDINKIRDKYF
jgi:hypothetical protein